MRVADSLSANLGEPDFVSLTNRGGQWQRWFAGLLSLLFFGGVAAQLDLAGLSKLRALLPASPAFWLVFAIYYLAAPAAEWVVFRRLWRLPAAGFAALVRKFVSNELLLGYSGEVYFYSWVRRHAALAASPFGAIKDMTITSALAGNAVTLLMLPFALPTFDTMPLGGHGRAVLLSIGAAMTISSAIMLFGRRIFTLARRDLVFMTGVHAVRALATTALLALLWHLAMPGVALALWLSLAALRLLLSRLPFLPNKDALFAWALAMFIGHDADVATLMAMIAALLVATHVAIGVVLGAADLAAARAP